MSQKHRDISFECDPALLDEVVTRELCLLDERGGFLALRYRLAAEAIYRLDDENERERGFAELNKRFWQSMRFEALISDALREYKELRAVRRVFVGRAYHRREEEADLIDLDDPSAPGIGIKAMPERFADHSALRKFLRHEFMHVADMRAPDFGYRREALDLPPMLANSVRERYRIFWDIYVDSRLLRVGKETVGSAESRYLEFAGIFENYPDEPRRRMFDSVWRREHFTHAEIFDVAMDPRTLWPAVDESQPAVPLRGGSVCPLCGFSTIFWPTVDEREAVALSVAIQQDFPEWQISHGLCSRCLERYEMEIETTSFPP